MQVKERAKNFGIELRGRLFVSDYLCPSSTKLKIAEKENINKVIKLEHRINAQIESSKDGSRESGGKNSFLKLNLGVFILQKVVSNFC